LSPKQYEYLHKYVNIHIVLDSSSSIMLATVTESK